MSDLQFTSDAMTRAEASRHIQEIEANPQNFREGDTAAALIMGRLGYAFGVFDRLCRFSGSKLVGMLAFERLKAKGGDHIFLHIMAVLPPYQGRGIGTEFLNRVKDVAQGIPVFTRGVNVVAFRALELAGYRRLPGNEYNPVYKWSDNPEHLGDDSPYGDG